MIDTLDGEVWDLAEAGNVDDAAMPVGERTNGLLWPDSVFE